MASPHTHRAVVWSAISSGMKVAELMDQNSTTKASASSGSHLRSTCASRGAARQPNAISVAAAVPKPTT
jgi:hypothetical protein